MEIDPPAPDRTRLAFQPANRGTLRLLGPLAVAIAIFVGLATSLAFTKAPWCDEGWFANPAYNLAFHGYMGTNVLEPSGHFLNAYLKGIQERTYIVVPIHMVALAGWFRLFGFSLLAMRAYSIIWGVLGLLFLFYILYRLFPDARVAQLGTLLTAIDFMYLWSSADGRMESCANALALASLAAYLYLRERNFRNAVLVSQVLGAFAVFTHPNALLVLLVIPVVIWRFDRSQVHLRHLFLAAAPYLFLGAIWSLYIAQNPSEFAAQFFANAAGPNSERRWTGIVQPWLAVGLEAKRYFDTYVASGLWSGVMNPWMLLVPILYLAPLISLIRNRRTLPASVQAFLACIYTLILGMTFLNGYKASAYMLYIIPFYNGALAFWLLNRWRGGLDPKITAAVVGVAFVSLHLSSSIQHIRADEYHRDYQPLIARLKTEQAAGKTIVGTSAIGFGMGFHGFADDWRLGKYSRLEPDLIVLDRSYRAFTKWYEDDDPLVFSHIVATLTSRYRLSGRAGSFWIFERIQPSDPPAPFIDVSQIGMQKKKKKAEYLFKQLLQRAETTKEPLSRAAIF